MPFVVTLSRCESGVTCLDERDPLGFSEWAQRRANRELRSFTEWALTRGLTSAPEEVNVPLTSVGSDIGYECEAGADPPEDGLCAGAHRDAMGWEAIMYWRYREPDVSTVESRGIYAPRRLHCSKVKGVELWWDFHVEDRWFERVCLVEDQRALILQHEPPGSCGYDRTDILFYTSQWLELEGGPAVMSGFRRPAR